MKEKRKRISQKKRSAADSFPNGWILNSSEIFGRGTMNSSARRHVARIYANIPRFVSIWR